jgi:hypothetical protein
MCHLYQRSDKAAQALDLHICPFSKKYIIPIYLNIPEYKLEMCVLGDIKLHM